MLITPEQAAKRLTSPDNIANTFVRNNSHFEIKQINRGGRSEGRTTDLTEEQRTEVALLAHVKPAAEVAKEYGISRQHVQNLKFGRVGARAGDEKEHSELKNGISIKKAEITDKALNKLMESLGLLSDEKMENCDAKELSTVASNMSKVVNNMSDKGGNDNSVKLMIYAPQVKEMKDFEVIEI